ncbi:MAG TPA: carboxypeptidase regulatory-like domain-containing protein [Thermoplasmata archaeon]|nr:carboxypeptidase regulatory-like domain-containing protein [Thermoplasmata archaeon]
MTQAVLASVTSPTFGSQFARNGGSTRRSLTRGIAIAVLLAVLTALPSVPIGGTPTGRSTLAGSQLSHAASTGGTRASDPTDYLLSHALAWSEVAAPPSGIGTGGGGMVANSSSGVAVAFGGESSGVLMNSTFTYTEATDRWSQVPTSVAPSPRSDFAFDFDPTTGVAVLFGGLTNLNTLGVSNETWTYSVHSGTWSPLATGLAPPARQAAAFAIVPSLGIAILYGGWNRNYSNIGSLTYSDLWEFNLSTGHWSEPTVSGPHPPPLEGARTAWDPSAGQLEMFGGCYPCSSAVWRFDPVSLRWTPPVPPATTPAPRGAANWAYDPTLGGDLLFGGTNGETTFNDTQVYFPANNTWVAETLPPAPAARSNAASAFLDVPNNETWLIQGGDSGAASFPDLWRLSPTSNLSLRVANASSPLSPIAGADVIVSGQGAGLTDSNGYLNLTQVDVVSTLLSVSDDPWFYTQNQTMWLVPGQPASLTVDLLPEPLGTVYVQVVAASGPPLPDTYLNLTVDAVRINTAPAESNATGNASFHGVPPGRVNVTGTTVGWRAGYVPGVLVPGGNLTTVLTMFPDPLLNVQVLGRLPNKLVPLIGAEVSLDNAPFGFTNSTGFYSGQTSDFGVVLLSANASGFVSSSERVSIPFTGEEEVGLVLPSQPYGLLTVTVRDANQGFPLFGATVITFTPRPLKFGTFTENNQTDKFGDAGFSLPPGNYSVSATMTNYLLGRLGNVSVSAGSIIAFTLFLKPVPPANVLFSVRDQRTGDPIVGANITAPLVPNGQTDRTGTYNATGLAPGFYHFYISAPGYLPNSSSLELYSTENLTVIVNLTSTHNLVLGRAIWQFNLFPGSLAQVWPFVLLPVLVLLGTFALLSMLRGSREEESSGTRRADAYPRGEDPEASLEPLD